MYISDFVSLRVTFLFSEVNGQGKGRLGAFIPFDRWRLPLDRRHSLRQSSDIDHKSPLESREETFTCAPTPARGRL